jgi:putative ABC transport system ATP-binding protein
MIETKDLKYQYDQQNQFQFPDIHCQTKEHCLILGPSGQGKSTLLHLLSGLLRPKQGEILINGTDISDMPDSKLDDFRGQQIGLIFQKNHFIAALTVEENLLLTQKLSGEKQDRKRIHELLERLNMSHKKESKPGRLSQGEQQRVAIARSLVNRPSVILADEPTSALDDENCMKVLHLLLEQAEEENASLIIVTHDTRLKDKISKQYNLA